MQKATSRGGFGGRNGNRQVHSDAKVCLAAAVNCYVKWSLTYCESLKNFGGLTFWPQVLCYTDGSMEIKVGKS